MTQKVCMCVCGVFLLSLCFCLRARAETFGNIYAGLDSLETLLNDMQTRNESLQVDIHNLETNLTRSGELLQARDVSLARLQALLTDLKSQSDVMREAYERQSQSLRKSERRLRNWRLFALIAPPITAAISGLAGYFLGGR